MKISRQVGSISQILQVYVQDFSVTTGAGIANVPATNVSYSWFRSNQNGVSTAMGGSTGTLGIYSSGAWLQINSATALGWYQFGLPNDALLSGDSVGIHFYVSSGPLTMAQLPIEIELTKINNQQYASSTVYSSTNVVAAVNSTLAVNVIQIYGSAAVTSASGQFQVSTQAIDKGGYGVTTIAAAVTTKANVIQIQGVNAVTSVTGMLDVNVTRIVSSAAATSAAGILTVSTQAIDKGGYGVTTIAANITTNANVVQIMGTASPALAGYVGIDWAFVTSKAAYNDLSSTFISTNQAIAGASAPTAAQVAQAVWDEIATSHSASSSFADVLKRGMSNVSTIMSGVNMTSVLGTASPALPGYVGIDWAFVTSKAAYNDLSSTFISTNQAIAGASAPTAAQVAQAVWDEIATSHTASSSFAVVFKNGMSNVSTVMTGVNITSIVGTAAVTSAGGQLRVSTQAIDKGGYGVTTIAANITTNANLLEIYGSAAITSAAGILTVSTQTLSGGSGSVNVTSIMGQPAVTTGAGILLVSTQTIPTFSVAGDAMALTAGERAAVAGVILTTTQAESYRSVNATGSMVQLMYEVLANVTDMGNSGTTRTLNSVTSHAAGTVQYQYDSTTPSAITRIA